MDLDYIDDIILDMDKCYLNYKNKTILSATNIKNLDKEIKKSIEPPDKDIKVFVVSFNKTKNKDKIFMENCFQSTITKKLSLIDEDDDNGKIITSYSKKELEKRKFKLSDVLECSNNACIFFDTEFDKLLVKFFLFFLTSAPLIKLVKKIDKAE
jgi:hypothetical protein